MTPEEQFQTALARIAQLEAQLNKKPEPAPQSLDIRAFVADPVGVAQKLGMDVEHLTKHFFAHAMGDQAPPPLKDYVRQGQQFGATTGAIESKLEALARRLEDLAGGTKRESFQKLAADKAKYPNLATVFAADPSLFDVGAGDPVEYAQKEEERLSKLATAFKPQSASAEVAATSSAKEQQAKPAPLAGAVQGDPPPIQQRQPGHVSNDVYEQLKNEVVRQYQPDKG